MRITRHRAFLSHRPKDVTQVDLSLRPPKIRAAQPKSPEINPGTTFAFISLQSSSLCFTRRHAMMDRRYDAKESKPDETTGTNSVMHTNVQHTLRKLDSGPSTPHVDADFGKQPRQVPVDLIEEEGMESFPASDPPGHFHSNTNREPPRRPGQKYD
jgi:hypothetical protein